MREHLERAGGAYLETLAAVVLVYGARAIYRRARLELEVARGRAKLDRMRAELAGDPLPELDPRARRHVHVTLNLERAVQRAAGWFR